MAPFEKAPLRHIPNVDILGAPPLLGFVNRKLLLDCAVSSSLRAMNVSHASLYFFFLFVSFLINWYTYKECQITSQEVIEGLCEQNPSAFSNLPSAVQNRYPVNAEVSIYRYGKRRTGVIVGVRENIVIYYLK